MVDFRKSQLRLHTAALQHLQSALHQRHGLHQFERRGTLAASTPVALLTIASEMRRAVPLLTIATLRPVAARALLVNRANFERGYAGAGTEVSDSSDSKLMNSWQFCCRIVEVNALPPTTKTVLPYSLSLFTSGMKSLSPLTMAKAFT